ncbi:MAG: nicotinamide mononucleotide transporter [Oscillospiraceae bacterium]|nr:nicotinamide mononucleotide transporter [Oscillospiraceae bacterium]
MKSIKGYFTKGEILLWSISSLLVTVSFLVFDRENIMTLCASLIGVTYLILNSKGNPIGQVLVIVFSLLYGIISYQCAYYGEMITYLGMTMPMAVLSLGAWLRNPFQGNRAQVKVNSIGRGDIAVMTLLTAAVTVIFYFVLRAFNTANLIPGTISVTTSFLAVYLTFRRSPAYAIAYSANDVVLIILWSLASMQDIQYVSVVVCFGVFLVNDIYSFFSWRRMRERQAEQEQSMQFQHT